jgi:gas vesicle protein
MGDLSDAVRNLVDDIRSSAESRHVEISEMKSDTHNMLERFYLEREDMAKALEERFSSDKAARMEAIEKLMNDVRSFMEDTRSELRDMATDLRERLSSDQGALREATQQFRSDIRSELRDMASALEERFSSDRAAQMEATQELVNDIKSFMSDVRSDLQDMANTLREKISSDNIARRETTQQFMGELAFDRRKAQEIWRKDSGGILERTIPEPFTEKGEEETVKEIALAPSSEDQILEVVAKHPEGIRLVDIGNELGVDWRSLIGAVKPLVDEHRVDKIDNLYYPKT